MCGIIGISSNKPVSANIINSLKKLEYRGYDSAGIATLSGGEINEVKSEGRVDNLEYNFFNQYSLLSLLICFDIIAPLFLLVFRVAGTRISAPSIPALSVHSRLFLFYNSC